ncbi:cation efflux system protein [Acetobacter nitrogenifigens DSM 23921 = NBRC 105050]|uniref:Cobalt transporter n=2 Tax=Acetobacter nitrogenifigens TaxID=285268 RepID=A0A511XE55_9PROT|nr:cation efflux system protein [Acetobacter nitrogenifigens DSM 23921 = NBRC 105050]GEN61232.1 cobalt transporter [Acetobacter nitrogenifigens DSM 23921 = NBRC 105050]
MALNMVYLVGETVWGLLANSVALLADAGHNLSDVLALAAAWLAERLTRRAPSARFTYGLRRSSILAALTNAVALLLVTGGVAWEAVLRLFHPVEVAGKSVMIVAALGVVVNGVTALFFMSGQKNDLNLRAAFLHMATDAVASLGVVATGALVLLTGLAWLDPAASLAISALIVLTTWGLLRDSLDMALDGVPKGVDIHGVDAFLRDLPDVTDLHDLHVWPMSTTETALTVHLVRSENATVPNDAILLSAGRELRARFGVQHATLQIEVSPCGGGCSLDDALHV